MNTQIHSDQTFMARNTNQLLHLYSNDAPTSIKNFKTLSYEGDAGWTASIATNEQSGTVSTWKKREGLYFNYIMGDATTLANIDTSDFSVQGIGNVLSHDAARHYNFYQW